VLAEKNYSKRLAFSYLEELAQEFHSQYGKKVNTVTRPYSFIEFGKKKRVISRNLWVRNIILLYNVLFS
jgi:vesicle transport protein SEC22